MLQWNDVGTLLVPVDLDDPTPDALAVAMGARPKALHVVYVLPELEPALMTQIDPAHRHDHAMSVLDAWLADRQAPEGARCHVRIGAAGVVVPEFAKEIDADLIVMNSHGRTGFARALMGSVAERVVRFSGCPVLVLKPGVG